MESLIAFLPYVLLFLLCPLMMLFMHRGGGHDDAHGQRQLDDRAELARRLEASKGEGKT